MRNEGQDLDRCLQIEKNSIKKVIGFFQKETQRSTLWVTPRV